MLPIIGRPIFEYGAMSPWHVFFQFQLTRTVTYMFLHDINGIFHILFNMLALVWFGVEIEDLWGKWKFLRFYLICGAGAALFTVFYLLMGENVVVIGASGAVLAVLTAYAMYYPERQILLFFVLPMKIRTLIIIYAVLSVVLSFGGAGGISHITHLGGIAVAWIYLKLVPMLQFQCRKKIYLWKNRKR
jgi:membrane associated rhomboid family serine protease